MEEMITDEMQVEQEFIDMAKAEMESNPKLKPCAMCMHFDPDKNWCKSRKVSVMAYNYGGSCFLTNEVALRALILREKVRSYKRKAAIQEKLDVMQVMVDGADMIRDDIQEMLEADYKRLDIKAKGDDAAYLKSKKNLLRLDKCYKEMKVALQNFESAYRNYIGYWQSLMFADEKGVYSPEFDKAKYNAGYCTFTFFGIYNKTHMNHENSLKLAKFIDDMEGGRDVLESADIKRYLIKI